jgi:hypothetical protein
VLTTPGWSATLPYRIVEWLSMTFYSNPADKRRRSSTTSPHQPTWGDRAKLPRTSLGPNETISSTRIGHIRVVARNDGGMKTGYDCIKAFSGTDFTEDLKKFDAHSHLVANTFGKKSWLGSHRPSAGSSALMHSWSPVR